MSEDMEKSQITAWLEKGRTLRDGTRLSDERLREVFNLVSPYDAEKGTSWKDVIRARVPKSAATEEELTLAIIWTAGSPPEIISVGDEWCVYADGYYEAIGS